MCLGGRIEFLSTWDSAHCNHMTAVPLRVVRGYRWWVAMLLAAFAGQAAWRVAHQSATWDEGGHLAAGYSYWAWGDYRVPTYNFVFAQKLAATPLAVLRPKFPAPPPQLTDPTLLGAQLLYELGNDPRQLLLASRLMVTAAGVLLGLLVAGWARKIFGETGALVALFFFAFEPNLLAHSSLVTTDIIATTLLLGLTWAWWNLLHHCDARRLLLFAALLTLMLITKYSFIVFAVIAGVTAAWRLGARHALVVAWPWSNEPRRIDAIGTQITTMATAGVAAAVLAWLGIWCLYSVQFSLPAGATDWSNPPPGTLTHQLISALRTWHVLPDAYVYEFTGLRSMVIPRPTFVAGLLLAHGVHWYFPLLFALKTPLPFLGALLASAIALILSAKRRGESGSGKIDLYACVPVVVLVAVYATSACASSLNLGVRHILPCSAAAAILCGALAAALDFRRSVHRWLLAGGAIWTFAAAAVAAQSPLAYFNELAGGPARGSRWAVDSSYDWGGELPALGAWLDQNVPPAQRDPVYLAYFGTALPEPWGVHAQVIEGTTRPPVFFGPGRWHAGWYVFSATILRGGASGAFGLWTADREKEFQSLLGRLATTGGTFADESQGRWLTALAVTRLAAKLRSRPPDAEVADNFFVFHLSPAEIDDLLLGSPPPMSPTPYSR